MYIKTKVTKNMTRYKKVTLKDYLLSISFLLLIIAYFLIELYL